jgi:hypothetical protein
MIQVNLCGGLGNQLFEYAFGRSLSLRCGLPIELDAVTLFKQDRVYKRKYELDAFTLPEVVEVRRSPRLFSRFERKLQSKLDKKRELNQRQYILEERPFRFQDELLELIPANKIKIQGYWQSEKYFETNAELIRKEMQFKKQPISKEWAERLLSEPQAVAVHIRRIQYSRCLSEGYYLVAMDKMRKLVPGCTFFCFSDDPEWAVEFFKGTEDCEVVVQKNCPAIEDFKLLTQCRHFIIANSSFSWWAAWLGEKAETKVLAPSTEIWDHPQSLPQRWNQIPVSREGSLKV